MTNRDVVSRPNRPTDRSAASSDPPTQQPAPARPPERSARGDGARIRRPEVAPPTPAKAPASPLATPARRRPWKHPDKDLRSRYGLHLQIGFVVALALLWGLTFVDFHLDDSFSVELGEQEVVQMEEVRQTTQEVEPPPPPRPTAPIEVANDAIIDDTRELNFDASLDLNEELDVGGPPEETGPPPEEEPTDEEEIFVVVEEQPELIGGLKALQEKIEYPEMAKKAGIEGRVIVQFIVDENGDVLSPTVVRGRHRLLDEEALRVIRQAKFTPGRQRGQAVKVQMALPITFVLAEKPR